MKIKIQALDTLFFRDGKPFTREEDLVAQSVFPPAPSTIYGSLRSAYFASHPNVFKHVANHLNTEHDPTSSLRIKGYFVALEGEYVSFPAPLDLVREKDDDGNAYLLELEPLNVKSNYTFNYSLSPVNKYGVYENLEGAFIDHSDLEDYLNIEEMSIDKIHGKTIGYMNLNKSVITEEKVGIALNSETGVAKQGNLYRVGMKRLINDSSIVVHIEGLDLKEHDFLRLGGKGKVAQYRLFSKSIEVDPPSFCEDAKLNGEGVLFKLYFATPTYFENGWLPSWIKGNNMRGSYEGIEVQLITAAVGKYVPLGGFDLKKRYPKVMQRLVPAGSVYYFKLLKGTIEDVVKLFHYNCISDVIETEEDTSLSQQGFGLCFVGKINKESRLYY